jgi:hypothetical protein
MLEEDLSFRHSELTKAFDMVDSKSQYEQLKTKFLNKFEDREKKILSD